MFEAFPTAGVKPAVGAKYQETGNSWPRGGEVPVCIEVPQVAGDTVLGGDPGLRFSLGVPLGIESYFLGSCRIIGVSPGLRRLDFMSEQVLLRPLLYLYPDHSAAQVCR